MFGRLERWVDTLGDYLENNKTSVIKVGGTVLGWVCVVIAVVYAVIFFRQLSAM